MNKILNWYYQSTVLALFKKKRFKHGLSIACFHIGIVSLFIFLFVLGSFSSSGQSETIWEENFTYNDGTTSATKDGIIWSADGVNSWGDGVAVYNNRLKLERTDRDNGIRNTWILDTSIDLLGYINVIISIDISSSANMETAQDYIQVEYKLDNGSWIILETNGYLQGNLIGTVNTTQSGLSGSSLLLRIVASNNNDEIYYVDNVIVTGLLTVSPSCAILSTPANGASGVELNTELDWNTDVYSTDYYFFFGTDNPPTNLINGSSLTATYYSPPADLNANTTYFWKVVPYNSTGQPSGCPVWSFTTGTEAVVDTIVKQLFNAGQDLIFTFPFNSCAIISDALLTITVKGDINEDNSNEFYNIIGENGIIGQMGPTLSGVNNDCDVETKQFTIINSDIQASAADNTITIIADPQLGVDEICPINDPSYVEMRLRYSYVSIPNCFITAPATVCKNEQNIIISGPTEMSSYSWSITNGDAVISGSNTSEFLTVNAGSNDFTVDLIVENYPGCSSSCSVDVTVDPESVVVGNVSADQSICLGNSPSDITLTGSVGTIQWQLSTDNINFTDIAGATSVILSSATIGTPNTTTYYRAMVDGGLCVARTEVVTINVLGDLMATITGGNSPICGNTSPGTITATGSGGSGSYTFQWYLNGVATSTNQNYDPGNLTNDATIYCEVTSFPCGTISTSSLDIVVNMPATPVIGTITQPDCITTTGSVVLNGLPASGAWQISQNPGNITTIGSGSNTTISGLLPGTYNFTVTEERTGLACPGTGTGLLGEYFNNMTLSGVPALTRTDATVDFNWGNGSPDPAIGTNNFSVRWSGKILPCYSEIYTFSTNSDDGIRLWVNGVQLINNWTDHGPTVNTGNIALTAGQKYDIVLEFYENGGGAVAELSWSSATQNNQIIPQSNLYLNSDFIPSCASLSSVDVVINTSSTSVTTQPSTLNIKYCENESASALTVEANGSGLSYQWYSNTSASTIGATAVGTDNPSYMPSTSSAGTLYYYVVISGDCTPDVTSNFSGAVTVTPQINNNSISVIGTVCAMADENSNAVLTAPSGTVFNNVGFASYGIPDGICESFTLGTCHATTSQAVCEGFLLGNNTATIPATNGIFGDPCLGTFKRLYVQASYNNILFEICEGDLPGIISGSLPSGGNGSYTYLWESSTTNSVSGFAIASGTNNTQNYTPGTLSQTTWFRRIITSGECSSTSEAFEISVFPAATVTTALVSPTSVCGSGSVSFSATASFGAIKWYDASSGGTEITNLSPTISSTTTYYAEATISGSCISASRTAVTATVIPLPTAAISSNSTPICEEEDAEFTITGTSGAIVTYTINGGADTTVALSGGTGTVIITGAITDQILTLVSVADANCSKTLSESSTVTVNPLPASGEIIPD